MSSLWTPGGEHRVEREPSQPAGSGAPGGGPAHPAPSPEELDAYRWLRDGAEMGAGIAPSDAGPARETEVVSS